jgi:hypothetical protein
MEGIFEKLLVFRLFLTPIGWLFLIAYWIAAPYAIGMFGASLLILAISIDVVAFIVRKCA